MKEREIFYNKLTDEEKAEILGTQPTKLFYKFNDYEYKTTSKPRILSGIKKLDYMLKGFELGCITLWSGSTNCLDKNTEYFNGKKWKKINEFTNEEKVLQYNLNGTATLEKPLKYIKQPCQDFLCYKSKSLDMVITENHDLVYMAKKNIIKKSALEVSKIHEKNKYGFNGKFITTFKYNGKGINLTDEQIRVMCMVICDGSFRKNVNTNWCTVNIKKERKILRAEKLLIASNIKYTKSKMSNGYTRFYFYAPIKTKVFEDYWYNCNNHQFEIITDEIMYWDGCKTKSSYEFSSNNKQNINFVQFAFEATGKRANLFEHDRRGQQYKDCKYTRKTIEYNLVISKRENTLVTMNNPHKKKSFEKVKSEDGFCYCFTMPSGMLVVRRNGKIMITGNCGKTSTLTLIARETLKQHNKVFFFNGEQTKDDFKNNIYKSNCKITDLIRVEDPKDKDIVDWYVKPEKVKELDKIYGENLIVYNNNISRDINTLIMAMEEAHDKLGVNCFILDNFMQIDINGDNIYQEQTKIMEKLRTFAVNKEVHIHLVAHPRKIEGFQVRLTLYDVAGTMNIPNKAYNVVSIIRKTSILPKSSEYKRLRLDLAKSGYNMDECDGILEVLKTKGNSLGLVGLVFDPILRTYKIANEIVGEKKSQLIRQIEIEYDNIKSNSSLPF